MQPVEPNLSVVEVDGISFETVVPTRGLVLPQLTLVQKILHILLSPISSEFRFSSDSVQIGIRMTNNTDTPVQFSFHYTLFPEMIGVDGQVPVGGGWIRLEGPRESDLRLAMPGESVTFFPEAKIFWVKHDHLGISIATGNGGSYVFAPFKLGTYKFRFKYQNSNTVNAAIYDFLSQDKKLEDLWIGTVTTPFVELHIFDP
jgi:hypothetical protein